MPLPTIEPFSDVVLDDGISVQPGTIVWNQTSGTSATSSILSSLDNIIQQYQYLPQSPQSPQLVYHGSEPEQGSEHQPEYPPLVVLKSRDMNVKSDEQFYNKKLSQVVGFRNGVQSGEIGLEIECEGTNLFRTPFSYWSCHDDGSLRAIKGHSACEYVLRSPLDIEDLRPALDYLNAKLKESGSEVIQSQRTSVHVHVNCQKMLIRELYNYLCLYLIFEEILVEWSGPERAGNLFCLRGKDSDYYINMLESVIKNKNFKQWRDDYRYSACNVASIPKFGSLEFRSMKGTVDIDTIMTWVEILLRIKEMSKEYKSPVEIVEDFTAIGPLPFFKKIFKENQRKILENIPGLSGKLWDGLRMMRDVAYCCEWKPPKDKKKRQKKTKLTT